MVASSPTRFGFGLQRRAPMPSHIGIVHGPAGSRRSGGAIPEPARSSGAIAILGQGGGRLGIVTLDVFDLPIRQPARAGHTLLADSAGPPELDLPRLAALLQIGALPAHAVIQQPSPRANQAASRVFARAQAYGAVLGVLAALRIQATPVYAAVWQRDMGVAAGPDAILARAGELFPDQLSKWQRARDVGRAYAAVLAEWGRRQELAQNLAQNSAYGVAHGVAREVGRSLDPAATPKSWRGLVPRSRRKPVKLGWSK